MAIAGPDRDFVTALLFPNLESCRALCGPGARELPPAELVRTAAVTSRLTQVLEGLAQESAGLSTSIARAMVMEQPPSIDAHETTEKGSINQKAVLANRAALVDVLYTEQPPSHVIQVAVP